MFEGMSLFNAFANTVPPIDMSTATNIKDSLPFSAPDLNINGRVNAAGISDIVSKDIANVPNSVISNVPPESVIAAWAPLIRINIAP